MLINYQQTNKQNKIQLKSQRVSYFSNPMDLILKFLHKYNDINFRFRLWFITD